MASHLNNCVLFCLPDPWLPVQLVATLIFIFVGFSSEADLTPLKQAHCLEENWPLGQARTFNSASAQASWVCQLVQNA